MKRLLLILLLFGCTSVPHESEWGVYSFDLSSNDLSLVFSSDLPLSLLVVHDELLAFEIGGNIFTFINGSLNQLTNSSFLDTYPAFSPDGSRVVYVVAANGTMSLYHLYELGGGQLINGLPAGFLCQPGAFASNNLFYFIGEWWE